MLSFILKTVKFLKKENRVGIRFTNLQLSPSNNPDRDEFCHWTTNGVSRIRQSRLLRQESEAAAEHPLLAMARWVHASTPHSRLLNSRQQWSTDRHYAARYYPPFYGASGDTCARGWYLVTRTGIRIKWRHRIAVSNRSRRENYNRVRVRWKVEEIRRFLPNKWNFVTNVFRVIFRKDWQYAWTLNVYFINYHVVFRLCATIKRGKLLLESKGISLNIAISDRRLKTVH